MIHSNRTEDALANPFPTDTLPVIGLDETVHDEDILYFSDQERVLCKDDHMKKQATTTYYDNLRQLATFRKLLVQK